jgi:hypothetical protein
MSMQLCRFLASEKSYQFIRHTKMGTASTTQRLVLIGEGFRATNEVVPTIKLGVATELVDAMMSALGSHFECLSSENMRILADMYTVA